MAYPTPVNGQITDSVTQSNVKVLAEAPSVALANLYQATAHALSLAAQNATANQQNGATLAQAVTAAAAKAILGEDASEPGKE